MKENKIEYQEKQSIPLYLNQSYIRGPGLYCNKINKEDSPLNNITTYASNGVIRFEINTDLFLDPFSLFLEFSVINLGDTPIQLDGSAHSIIKKIEVRYKNTNKILEKIDDYDILQSLYFDMHLTRKERKERHELEGFGYNQWGSNETIIPNLGYEKPRVSDTTNIARMDLTRLFNSDSEDENKQIFDYYASKTTDILRQPIDDNKFKDVNDIKNFKQWEYIKNGKIYPFNETIAVDYKPEYNIKKFKIPLMLKLLGHGIQPDNFKYIPMKIIGPIYINITLNPNAFFIPYINTKLNYFFDIESFISSIDYLKKIKYQINDAKLYYQLIELNDKAENEIYQQVRNNNWFLDYKNYGYLNHFYLFGSPTQDGISEFREQCEIKSIYIFFLTNLYEHSPYSRRLSRHNKGIKRLEFIWNHITYPEVIQDHNSLTNIDKDYNVEYFWNEFSKSVENINLKDSNNPCDKLIINKQNFTINKSLSELVALFQYIKLENISKETNEAELFKIYDDEWIDKYKQQSILYHICNNVNKTLPTYLNNEIYELDDFSGYMDDFQCKTIFALNFDDMPYSYGQFRNGIKVKENQKFKIRLTRSDKFEESDYLLKYNSIYNYMYVYAEYYETVVLTSNGEFLVGK